MFLALQTVGLRFKQIQKANVNHRDDKSCRLTIFKTKLLNLNQKNNLQTQLMIEG